MGYSHGRFVTIFDDRKVLDMGEGDEGTVTDKSKCQLLAPRLWCSEVSEKGATACWVPVGMPVGGVERRDSLAEDVSSYSLEVARHTCTWQACNLPTSSHELP